MARLFDDAQNERLEVSVPVLDVPITLALWLNVDEDTNGHSRAMSVTDISDSNRRITIAYEMTNPEPNLRLNSHDGSTNVVIDHLETNENLIGKWHHLCATDVGTGRELFFDGASEGTNATSLGSMSGLDTATLGAKTNSGGTGDFWSGSLLWPAIWDVALSDANILALALGWHPTLIRPDALIAFWPLGGLDTEETDGGTARGLVGGYDMAAFSDATGPGISDHRGGLIVPSSAIVVPGVAAAVPAGNRRRRMLIGA